MERCRSFSSQFNYIEKELKEFAEVSGLLVNFHKSHLTCVFFHALSKIQKDFSAVLGIPIVYTYSKYLSITITKHVNAF